MGSWNETCAISNFPINPGEKVKVILLENVSSNIKSGKTGVYSQDFWGPMMFPLSGIYDDYGRARDLREDSQMCKVILDVLQPRHAPVAQGKNEYHDVAVPHLDTMNDLLTGLEHGRVRVVHRYANYSDDPADATAAVCRVYVREDVWDMIAKMELEDYDRKISAEAIFRDAFKYFRTLVARNNELKGLEGEELSKVMLRQLHETTDERTDPQGFMRFFQISSSGSDSPRATVRAISARLRSGELTIDHPDFLRMIKAFSEMIVVLWYLENIRFGWHPTIGSGSQESDVLLRAKHHAALAQLAVKIEQARREEWGDEDDEEAEPDPFKDVRETLEATVWAVKPKIVRKKKQ